MYSQQHSSITEKRLRTDHPEEMPLKGGIVALCPYHVHLPHFRRLTIIVCTVSKRSYPTVHRISSTRIVSYCSCALEWWDVRTPGAILNVFDFLDYTYFKISISLILKFSRLLVSFASLAELYTRIMVTIKKRAGVVPYSFSSSIALLSSLLSCSFYLLGTISSVDILEMT